VKKIKVAVLYGGPSAEREVSLVTGRAVLENLDKKKYQAYSVEMTRDKCFVLNNNRTKKEIDLQWFKKQADIVFIALHGSPGEDGGIQGMLESVGVRYTGPGVLASALAMNKLYASEIFLSNGLPVPVFEHVKREGWKKYKSLVTKELIKNLGLPLVIKPINQGSAVGISIVKTQKEFILAMDKTIKDYDWVMVQKFIKGHEVTCGILEVKGVTIPLPPTLILPKKSSFYDYASKYASGGSDHVCPAPFPKQINNKIQEAALKCHKALGCRGMSRTDIILVPGIEKKAKKKRKIENYAKSMAVTKPFEAAGFYILETNTIPGMTPTSLLPEAAKVAGYEFGKMLDLIIEAGR